MSLLLVVLAGRLTTADIVQWNVKMLPDDQVLISSSEAQDAVRCRMDGFISAGRAGQ